MNETGRCNRWLLAPSIDAADCENGCDGGAGDRGAGAAIGGYEGARQSKACFCSDGAELGDAAAGDVEDTLLEKRARRSVRASCEAGLLGAENQRDPHSRRRDRA